MQRETKHQLTRWAFLPLSLALVIGASGPSWAGQYIEREDCAEAATHSNPMPPSCTGRRVLDTYKQTNQRGQETCQVEIVEYECKKSGEGISLSHQLEYFPLGSAEGATPAQQGDAFNSGDSSEGEPASQEGASQPEPGDSQQPWSDVVAENPPVPFNPYSQGQQYEDPVGKAGKTLLPQQIKNKPYKGKGRETPILAPNPKPMILKGHLTVKLSNGQRVRGRQRKDDTWEVLLKDKKGRDKWVLAERQ